MNGPRKVAIVSDIHGNLEALEQVLVDIRALEIERIICLGDIVGYGPNPKECIDAAMRFDVNIMGNHEEAILFEEKMTNFNVKARQAINWQRSMLMEPADNRNNHTRWDFIGTLQPKYEEGGNLFVHGSPRDPIHEYLFPAMAETLADDFNMFENVCFIGHTHIPGIFTPELRHLSPEDADNKYQVMSKAIINVGSVGQPRDGNNQACYVVYEASESTVVFRRVPYDYEKTLNKIRNVEQLDDSLGERLALGK